LLIFTLFPFMALDAQQDLQEQFSKSRNTDHWAEEQLSKMNLTEKISQLMILRMPAQNCETCIEEMLHILNQYPPGGICFFKGSAKESVEITNRLQSASKIPMLITIDGEWGPAMRLDDCLPFPRQMALGAINNRYDSLIYDMGYEVGKQCIALGIHLNFAPVVDINNNSKNPVIGNRSFGENRKTVTQKALYYMRGMQDAGLLTCLKHFPGHGDCTTDSHKSLPVIKKSREALESLELYPFKQLIQQGADMVMCGHLNVPALDERDSAIATLSYPIITELLKKEIGFKGLVITDAMEMQGVRNYYSKGGEAEIKALQAGIDLLLLPENLEVVVPAIKRAIDSGRLTEELINERCLRVLKLKQRIGLQHRLDSVSVIEAYKQINTPEQQQLLHLLEQKSLTLLKNEDQILPLNLQTTAKAGMLVIGNMQNSDNLAAIAQKYNLIFVQHDKIIRKKEYAKIDEQLSGCDTIIAHLLGTGSLPPSWGITEETVNYLEHLSITKKIILVIHGTPYALMRFKSLNSYKAIAITYQPSHTFVATVMEAIFGYVNFEGQLPVSVGHFKAGYGLSTTNVVDCATQNCSYLSQQNTRSIDSMVYKAISQHVMPGCQVVALQQGKVLFAKAYGYLTYDTLLPVTLQTLYDVASITKSAATTLAVMKLYDEKRFKLNDPIGRYLTFLQGSDKANILINELLTHTSGLKAFIPFYQSIATQEGWDKEVLSDVQNANFPIEVANHTYVRKGYDSVLLKLIAQSPLAAKYYVYSDLNFVLLKELVEMVSGMSLDHYLDSFFYKPMGLTCCFNPLSYHIDMRCIAPTETDNMFRKQTLHGYVHDQTAALFGGVSGNAGLFASGNDLIQIFQMLLNRGFYKGKRYISEETVKLFTTTYPLHGCRRRALGFDTPNFDKKSEALPSAASRYTFGHQGFTGTVVWCDPEKNLIYVFLSNRVFPNVEPNKLVKSGLRTIVMDRILSH